MNAYSHVEHGAIHAADAEPRLERSAAHQRAVTNEFRLLAALSATGLAVGLADVGGGAFSGLCLAGGAILFGLSFIFKALHVAEQIDS